ncbi:hypothetical protein AMTRI_Chr09g33590 [Amborella trichopoda]
MASLEQLLAEDGFLGRKSTEIASEKHMKCRSKVSSRSIEVSLPMYICNERNAPGSGQEGKIRLGRTISDVSRHKGTKKSPNNEKIREIYRKGLRENERFRERLSADFQEKSKFGKDYHRKDSCDSERIRGRSSKDLWGKEEIKDVHRLFVHGNEKFNGNFNKDLQVIEDFQDRHEKDGEKETFHDKNRHDNIEIVNLKGKSGVYMGETENLEDKFKRYFSGNEKFEDKYQRDKNENKRSVCRSNNSSTESEKYKDACNEDFHYNESPRGRYKIDYRENENFKDKPVRHLHENEKLRYNSREDMKVDKSYSKLSIEQVKEKHQPALDEAAIRAVISILTSYIGRFIKDKNFRLSLSQNCLSCIGLKRWNDAQYNEKGIVANLKEAVQCVEGVVGDLKNHKELKKAALQLSIVAGLNSKDLKEGHTSGIPNSHLAACAHLYLSVIYRLQKKDRASARHLLQVFCDSPFQARVTLVSDLWEHFFLPHLSHLKVWYSQEAEFILKSSSGSSRMKLLDKLYGEQLDSGTYQFAVYYEEWLKEGAEAPPIPCVSIPSSSVYGSSRESSHGPSPKQDSSPIISNSEQPVIRQSLYKAVFGSLNNIDGLGEVNNGKGDGDLDGHSTCATTVPAEDDERIQSEHAKLASDLGDILEEQPARNTPENASHDADSQSRNPLKAWGSPRVIKELEEEEDNIPGCSAATEGAISPHQFILKKLAKDVFQMRDSDETMDSLAPINVPDIETKRDIRFDSRSELCGTESASESSNFDTNKASFRSFFQSTPKDFICPLTGQLFEDPVTLETGQTFERSAIEEWLRRGNKMCPTTKQALEYLTVPSTNFVLKRVLDAWKLEHYRYITCVTEPSVNLSMHNQESKDTEAVHVIEQLLTGSNREESIDNAKHLISLGGLEFLIERFEFGDLEEKTIIAYLFCCCIKADGGCRDYLVKNITGSLILELLQSKQSRSRAIVVSLLTELICLHRRTVITAFLRGFQNEGVPNTTHILLVYLQTSPLEQRPLVATLLLQLDLLGEPRRYSIYREEAINGIVAALNCSLNDENVRPQLCRALLILGGRFSYLGEASIEAWLLKQAGFSSDYLKSRKDIHELLPIDDTMQKAEEEKAWEEYSKNMAISLLRDRKPFLDSLSKCILKEVPQLSSVGLVTVAWITRALASLHDSELLLSAFSVLAPCLKSSLENGKRVEDQVLASLSVAYFLDNPDCQSLLLVFVKEMMEPLEHLSKETWTARSILAVVPRDL